MQRFGHAIVYTLRIFSGRSFGRLGITKKKVLTVSQLGTMHQTRIPQIEVR